MASAREILLTVASFSDVSRNRTTSMVEMRSKIGNSFLTVFLLTIIGVIAAPTPRRSMTFTMLLPTTLPRRTSVLPLIIEEMETASSGAPVPNAIMVRPISIFDTLKFCATEDAPEINQSAPLIKSTKPATNITICRNISIYYCLPVYFCFIMLMILADKF